MNIQTFFDNIRARQAVLSFSGWPDAGNVIQHTLTELKKFYPAELAAAWDMDGYWHTESSRPQVRIRHGQIQQVEWPMYRFFVCDHPSGESILIGSGPEPTLGWRSFARQLLGFLGSVGCEEVFLLGSTFDEVFHDDVVISGVVQDPRAFNALRELGCQQVDYSGPGAVHAAVMEVAEEMQMSCLGIWCHFPYYLNSPHELLMANLLDMLGSLLDLEIDTAYLDEDWKKREKEIEELILQDSELRKALETIPRESHLRIASRPGKVVRLDEFLKKRQEPEQEPEEDE